MKCHGQIATLTHIPAHLPIDRRPEFVMVLLIEDLTNRLKAVLPEDEGYRYSAQFFDGRDESGNSGKYLRIGIRHGATLGMSITIDPQGRIHGIPDNSVYTCAAAVTLGAGIVAAVGTGIAVLSDGGSIPAILGVGVIAGFAGLLGAWLITTLLAKIVSAFFGNRRERARMDQLVYETVNDWCHRG